MKRSLLPELLWVLGITLLVPTSLGAQEGQAGGAVIIQTPLPAQLPQVETQPPAPSVTPRGAFLRSLLIPGWGQVATGAVSRGGIYFALQSGSLWMLRKSMLSRGDAKRFSEAERDIVIRSLEAAGITDPAEVQQAIEADTGVRAWDNLTELRSQQVEDWIALSIFLSLLGAADALVSAHLMDYPEPLTLRVYPGESGEGVQLGFVLPVGGGR